MNIGIVLSKTPSYSETFFVSQIRGLQKSGFKVTLFVQKKETHFDLCKTRLAPKIYKHNLIFQFFSFAMICFKLIPYYKRVFKFVKLEKETSREQKQIFKNLITNSHILTARLDWLHFGFTTLALQSENVASAIGSKMAISMRGYDIDVYPLKHENKYQLIWRKVTKVHSISKYLLEKAHQLGLNKETSNQIITPAIQVLKFQLGEKQKASKELQIVTVARLHWVKGLVHTLEALLLLKNDGFNFKYTIIGSGEEYEQLLFTINQLGLVDNVILAGQISHEEIINHLKMADIYVQYSLSEGFCNSVLEAQAMEVLTVVSNGGALGENVVHNTTGYVVPMRQPVMLFETLKSVILSSEEIKNDIRVNAKNRVSKYFNLQKQQEEFVLFYTNN
nr:glycosyltransferase family 4 protein [uncultured Psychroserpens sp.]